MFNAINSYCYLALLVGIIGIVNNLVASFIERKRSFAMYRCVGMSKKSLNRMLITEAVGMGVFGVAFGISVRPDHVVCHTGGRQRIVGQSRRSACRQRNGDYRLGRNPRDAGHIDCAGLAKRENEPDRNHQVRIKRNCRPMNTMIEVENVSKSFQLANQTVEVLKNINLEY